MSRLHTPAAHRYEVDVPLRYRRAGDPRWYEGRTVNASRTGVLFQASGEEFDTGTAVELQLELPGSTRPVRVLCTGAVVRCDRSDAEHLRMAATIDVYEFGPEGSPTTRSLPSA